MTGMEDDQWPGFELRVDMMQKPLARFLWDQAKENLLVNLPAASILVWQLRPQ